MSRSALAVSALFLALLLATLGPKIWLAGRLQLPSDAALASALAARLRAAGMTAVIEKRPVGLAVLGSRGACRIGLRSGDDALVFSQLYASWARGIGALTFAYRGRLTVEPPVIQPKVESVLQNQLAMIGIATHRPAVVALARSPGCGDLLPDLRGIEIVPAASRPGRGR